MCVCVRVYTRARPCVCVCSNPNIDRELLQEPEKYNLMSRPDLMKPLQILGSSRPVLGARGSGHVPIRERYDTAILITTVIIITAAANPRRP